MKRRKRKQSSTSRAISAAADLLVRMC